MPSIPHILERHADEVSTLWDIRKRALLSPRYSLRDLERLDARLDANIEGLTLAGEEGVRSCVSTLGLRTESDVFAAAVVAMTIGSAAALEQVRGAALASEEGLAGLIAALRWLPLSAVEQTSGELARAPEAALRRASLCALAQHHGADDRVSAALADQDATVRATALRAVGELHLDSLAPRLESFLSDAHPACSFWAAWSLAACQPHDRAQLRLSAEIDANGLQRQAALELTIRRLGPSESWALIQKLAGPLGDTRSAVIAAGLRADPALVPWLSEQLETSALARLAGEALASLMGVELEPSGLAGEPPGAKNGEAADGDAAWGQADPDAELAWPAQGRLGAFWAQQQSRFASGTRYLLGAPISVEQCRSALHSANQRRRASAATELMLVQPTRLFDVTAPCARQRDGLAQLTAGTARV